MKNLFFNLKIFISLLLLVIASSIKAQGISGTPVLSEGCLGIHCYVTVDLDNDPVVNGGYVKYTIPTPRENLDYIQGPAGAYLSNNLGNTVDIYVRKIHLELALSDYVAVEVPFELFVKTDTGDISGSLLSDKIFLTETDTGSIKVPQSVNGGKCELTTDTGDIRITVSE